MKLSENWLREWVNPQASSEELGHRLTMAGLELDEMYAAAPDLSGVIVARIDEIQPHPDADRLNVCQVNTGNGKLQQVVCGASNARAGLVAAFATEGATLPGGTTITATKLRGVDSCGMLCSSAELGLDEDAEGLFELDSGRSLGEPLEKSLGLRDVIFDIDLTPNRADCLSVRGIAREVSALYKIPVSEIETNPVAPNCDDNFPVNVEASHECPRYCGRVLRDINARASTPLWIRERLRRSGIRSISLVVDICNYVMLECGQPMHAFDLNKLSDHITVRMARAEEPLTLLDGREVSLQADNLVIADSKGVLALAGVMGGLESAVELETTDIFLESAYFDPLTIAGKARKFGLHTESSHRFERGVDPKLANIALERASELIKEYSGARVGEVIEVVDSSELPVRAEIPLNIDVVGMQLGIETDADEIQATLKSLACEVTSKLPDKLHIVPPSFRFDLEIEADLVEEIARIRGYDQLPTTSLEVIHPATGSSSRTDWIYAAQQNLSSLGYHEAVTFSFSEQKFGELFGDSEAKVLANPISSELSSMRTSLWPGLCQAAEYNLKRQQSSVKLFEIGRKYLVSAGGVDQIDILAGMATGDLYPRQWGLPARPIDFYDVKGDLEWLFEQFGLTSLIRQDSESQKGLHPGKTLQLYLEDKFLGVIGILHPNTAKALNLPNRDVVVFELQLDLLAQCKHKNSFRAWSKFPLVRRDLSFTVGEAVPVQKILDKITSLQIKELQDIAVFALYQGEGIPQGRKSVSLGLILQDFSSTLTDQKVEQIMTDIISLLATTFKAQLRNA